MLDTRGVKKMTVGSVDTGSAFNGNDSSTSNNVVPSPLKTAPAKTTTRGRGSRGGRGAARGAARASSTKSADLSTNVSSK